MVEAVEWQAFVSAAEEQACVFVEQAFGAVGMLVVGRPAVGMPVACRQTCSTLVGTGSTCEGTL